MWKHFVTNITVYDEYQDKNWNLKLRLKLFKENSISFHPLKCTNANDII